MCTAHLLSFLDPTTVSCIAFHFSRGGCGPAKLETIMIVWGEGVKSGEAAWKRKCVGAYMRRSVEALERLPSGTSGRGPGSVPICRLPRCARNDRVESADESMV